MTDAKLFYQQRLTEFSERETQLSRQSQHWSQLRLLLFLIGLVITIIAFWDLSKPNLIWLLPAFAAFSGLNFAVSRHQKIRRALAYAKTMIEINTEALARLDRNWKALPNRDISTQSVLAQDLNLCGHASLFHLICRSGTHLGRQKLWEWVQHGVPIHNLGARQASVRECAQHPEWIQELECLGRLSEGKATAILSLKTWCERELPAASGLVNFLSFCLPLLLWAILLGSFLLGWPYSLIFLLMVINTGLSRFQSKTHQDEKLWAGESSIAPLGELFGFLAKQPFNNPELKEWQSHLVNSEAQLAMKDLAKWIHFQDVRRSELMHSILKTLFLWDVHIDRGMKAWHNKHGSKFADWLDSLIKLDALISLSGLHYDHPNWCFAQLEVNVEKFEAKEMGHPLLTETQVVRNDVQLSKDKPLLLVSGSNMAGKSTLLRALGMNIVLGQMGAPLSATSMHGPYFALGTSFRVNDSLADGVSYFMAELQQLKSVVNLAQTQQHNHMQVLFLFDEILLGTNIHDRQIAVRQVTQNLLQLGTWGAISTHDLSLSEVDDIVTKMIGVHFAETFHEVGDQVSMSFDYKLKPGLAKTSNALYLVKMVGLADAKPN